MDKELKVAINNNAEELSNKIIEIITGKNVEIVHEALMLTLHRIMGHGNFIWLLSSCKRP